MRQRQKSKISITLGLLAAIYILLPSVAGAAPVITSFTSSANNVTAGTSVTLTANTSENVGPTPYYIRIYNGSSQLSSCGSGTSCSTTQTINTTTTFTAKVENSDGSFVVSQANLTVSVGSSSPPPPSGSWTFCANENDFCSFSGTRQVRYGAGSTYNYQTKTDGTWCDNGTFGDPIPGTVKHCDYGDTTSSPPPPPPAGSCDTSFPSSVFHVCFFSGTNPDSGSFLSQENDGSSTGFFHDWGTGTVGNSGRIDQVSAVWRGRINFSAGTYNFHVKSDDGIDLKLDGNALNIGNSWRDQGPTQYDANNVSVSEGYHDIQVRWYENGGGAYAQLWWDFVAAPSSIPVSPTLSGPSTALKGSTITHTWTSTANTSYYMIRYKRDGGSWGLFSDNGQITGTSRSVATTLSNTSLAAEVISCNSGGSCSWPPSNIVTTTLTDPPPLADNCGRTSTEEVVCIYLDPLAVNVTQGYSANVLASYRFEPNDVPRFVFDMVNLPSGVSVSPSPTNAAPLTCFPVSGGRECRANFTLSTAVNAPLGTNSILTLLAPGVFTPVIDLNLTLVINAPTVSVSLSASPNTGLAPLTTTLTADVSGTAQGTITYTFNCGNSTPVQTFTTTNTQQTASCSSYTSTDVLGTNYAPSVSVTRQGQSASRTTVVSVYPQPSVDIKANGSNGPVSLTSGQWANLTWTSSNANYCTSSGQWGNTNKPLNNSAGESSGFLSVGTYVYTLTCGNGGGSASDSVTIIVTSPPILEGVTPPPGSGTPLGAPPCYGSPNPALTFGDVTWKAHFTGGINPYTYKWSFQSGSNTTNSSPVSGIVSYASPGSQTASVRITSSDGQTINISCSLDVNGNTFKVYNPPITTSCSANKSTAFIDENVIWSASGVSGGSGSYTYSWSGTDNLTCPGQPKSTCNSIAKSYSTTGDKGAAIKVYSGGTGSDYESGVNYKDSICVIPTGGVWLNILSTPDPTVSISAANTTIGYRGDASISWSSTNASSCSVSPTGWTGISGSNKVDQNLTTSKTYRATCNGLNEKSATQVSSEVRVKVGIALTCSVSPTETAINSPVTWQLNSAVGGSGSYAYSWTGSENLSGTTQNVSKPYSVSGPKSGTVTVTSDGLSATCTPTSSTASSGGSSSTTYVTIYNQLDLSCSATPSSTTVGNEVIWSSTASQGKTPYTYSWSGMSGTNLLSGSTASVKKTYSTTGIKTGSVEVISADNQVKSCSSSATISNKPSVSSFTTTDADIIQGETTTLSWACADSTTSSGTNFNTGGAVSGGPVSVSPNTTTTYTLTCTNSLNESTSAAKTINVTPQSITASLIVSPTSGRAPLNTTIKATAGGVAPAGLTQNYSLWWNCNSNATIVSEAVGACDNLPAGVPGTCQTNSNGAKCDGISNTTQSVSHTYSSQGSYTTKVIIERGPAPSKEARTTVSVDYPVLEPAFGQSQTKTSSANSPVTFAVQGGDGSYSWSAPNRVTPRSGSGSTFTVSADKSGSYTITVTSETQSMNFTLIVASTILNFNASPRVVNPGQSSVLSWLTTGYQSCSIDQGIGSVALDSGTKTIFYKEGVTQITYTLTCEDQGNKRDSSQVTVGISKVPKLKEIVPR